MVKFLGEMALYDRNDIRTTDDEYDHDLKVYELDLWSQSEKLGLMGVYDTIELDRDLLKYPHITVTHIFTYGTSSRKIFYYNSIDHIIYMTERITSENPEYVGITQHELETITETLGFKGYKIVLDGYDYDKSCISIRDMFDDEITERIPNQIEVINRLKKEIYSELKRYLDFEMDAQNTRIVNNYTSEGFANIMRMDNLEERIEKLEGERDEQ